jgi:hypothetical protein
MNAKKTQKKDRTFAQFLRNMRIFKGKFSARVMQAVELTRDEAQRILLIGYIYGRAVLGANTATPSSQRQYEEEFDRTILRGKPEGASPTTLKFWRRSVRYGIALALSQIFRIGGHARKDGRTDVFLYCGHAAFTMIRSGVKWGVVKFDGGKIEDSDGGDEKLIAMGNAQAGRVPRGRRASGKRRGLRGFRLHHPGFVSPLVATLADMGWGAPAAVSSVIGPRTSEFVRNEAIGRQGVRLWQEEPGTLTFEVVGSKAKAGVQGQPVRVIKVEITSDEARYLERLVHAAPNRVLVVSVESAGAYKDAMRRASKKIWPDSDYVCTPYTLRHCVRDRLRGVLTKIQIAYFMGHSNDISQGHYGVGRTGSSTGRDPVLEVRGTNAVREVARNIEDIAVKKKAKKEFA